MIISDTHRFVFIHNPKCAGTTVRKNIEILDTRDNFFWMYEDFHGRKVDKAHLPLNILRLMYPNDYSLLEEYFVFGFVRNPYDRFVSAFNEVNKSCYKKYISGEIHANEYIENVRDFVGGCREKNLSGWDFKYRHFVKQCNMFYFGGKLKADYICKVEEMEAFYKALPFFLMRFLNK